jgi:hypothetical protein
MVRLVAFALAVLVAGCSGAVALEPTRPSQIVMLTTSGGASCGPSEETALDNQVLPDGTRVPFTLPPGQVLVLTGMSWNLFGQTPDRLTVLGLAVKLGTGIIVGKFRAAALADAGGRSSGSVLIPKVVVRPAPGLPLCVGGFSAGSSGGVFVYGFLNADN